MAFEEYSGIMKSTLCQRKKDMSLLPVREQPQESTGHMYCPLSQVCIEVPSHDNLDQFTQALNNHYSHPFLIASCNQSLSRTRSSYLVLEYFACLDEAIKIKEHLFISRSSEIISWFSICLRQVIMRLPQNYRIFIYVWW